MFKCKGMPSRFTMCTRFILSPSQMEAGPSKAEWMQQWYLLVLQKSALTMSRGLLSYTSNLGKRRGLGKLPTSTILLRCAAACAMLKRALFGSAGFLRGTDCIVAYIQILVQQVSQPSLAHRQSNDTTTGPAQPPAGQSQALETAPYASRPEWTEHLAPDGRTYFYNSTTRQSRWTRPAVSSENPVSHRHRSIFSSLTCLISTCRKITKIVHSFLSSRRMQSWLQQANASLGLCVGSEHSSARSCMQWHQPPT